MSHRAPIDPRSEQPHAWSRSTSGLWTRRSLLTSFALGGAALAVGSIPLHAEPPPEDPRLTRRIELWEAFSRKTHQNMIARTLTTRRSALLDQALVTTGSLALKVPDLLVLTDDDVSGSQTRFEDDRVYLALRRTPAGERRPIDPKTAPALLWTRDRMLALLSPGPRDRLHADCDLRAAKGKSLVLEMRPYAVSPLRRFIRLITASLDATTGAVIQIELHEAQGDVVTLGISDHRQDVDEESLTRLTV